MNESNVQKRIQIRIETSQEHLDERNVSLEDVKKRIDALVRIFGRKYPRFFPSEISTNDIDRILYVASELEAVEGLDGFDRHIELYTKDSFEDHMFTAKTAAWAHWARQGRRIRTGDRLQG